MYFQKSHYIRDHFTEKISAHHLAHLSIIHQYSIKKCIGKNQHDLNSIVCKSSRSGLQPVQEEGICLDFNRKAQPPKTVVSKSWKQPLEWIWIDHYQSLQRSQNLPRKPHKDLYWPASFEFQFAGFFSNLPLKIIIHCVMDKPSNIQAWRSVLDYKFWVFTSLSQWGEQPAWWVLWRKIVSTSPLYHPGGWGLKITSSYSRPPLFHYFGQCKENRQPSLLRWKCSEAIQKLKSLLIFQASTCAWCRDPGLTPSAPMQWSSGVYLLN